MVSNSIVTVFLIYRVTEILLWKIQWKLTNMRLLKLWEKMVSSMLFTTHKLKRTWHSWNYQRPKKNNSQPKTLMPSNIQNRHWKRICCTKPLTWATVLKFQNNKIFQPNSSQDQKALQPLSTEATTSILDLILSRLQVEFMPSLTNEKYRKINRA